MKKARHTNTKLRDRTDVVSFLPRHEACKLALLEVRGSTNHLQELDTLLAGSPLRNMFSTRRTRSVNSTCDDVQ